MLFFLLSKLWVNLIPADLGILKQTCQKQYSPKNNPNNDRLYNRKANMFMLVLLHYLQSLVFLFCKMRPGKIFKFLGHLVNYS